jgi:hypothetical protein
MIPFFLPAVVAVAGGAIFVFASSARPWLKGAVAGAVLASLVLQHGFSSLAASTAGLVLQVVVAVFVLLYFRTPVR